MLLEGDDDDTRLNDAIASSFILSCHPTLAELRYKFPFKGSYHFRLQVFVSGTLSRYYWRDLIEADRLLPVSTNGEMYVKVLQLESLDDNEEEIRETRTQEALVDLPEDQQFNAFFHWQDQSQREEAMGLSMSQPQTHKQHSVLFGVKKALLASKTKSSAMAQTLQKHSAQMWEKVTAAASGSGGGGCSNTPPTASALTQLAKLIGSMKTPLHPANPEHVEMLQQLWTSCFDTEPFKVISSEWNRFGFRYGDPVREMQLLLPLQCLVFFHEVHRTVALSILNGQNGPEVYPYALVGSQIAYLLADLLQLRDGGCLGLERPFWKLFEDSMAFYELFCIAFRVFDTSWKLNSTNTADINFHLNYVGEFAQELLRRGPENIPNLIEHAHQLQNW
ncbi:unnamed protein product [Peronospora destructor]|uniref:ELMO domain-containing protein n=1 Tax=Peronospora destructor TaxID=86335 RepID=A0AAV0V661_9STRA|nr:unnamed protein product [Peronospora destructor]